MQKQRLITYSIVFVVLLWVFRYDLQAREGGFAYVLDRWTGEISWVRGAEIETVTKKPPSTSRDLFQESGIEPTKGKFIPDPPNNVTSPITIDEFLKNK